MSLIRVYSDPVDGSITPYSPWQRTKQASGGGGEDVPLDLYGAEPTLYWRGVYSSDDWIDNNHAAPDGIGYLSLLAWANHGSQGGPAAVIGGPQPYNLIGAEFRMDVGCVSSTLRIGPQVRLLFWAQFHDPTANQAEGRLVNLGYVAQPIDRLLGFASPYQRTGPEEHASDFKELVVTFDPAKPWQWVAYGTSVEDCAKYGTPNSLHQTFSSWSIDLGIHAIYGQTVPSVGDLPWGHLNLRNLSLWVDPDLNPDAVAV